METMGKKVFKIFLLLVLFLSLATRLVASQENQVTIYFFWSKTCPHCAAEKVFLEKLVTENPQVRLKSFELSDPTGIKLLQKAGEILKADTRFIPFTVIGNQYLVGYFDDQSTGKEIRKAIHQALSQGCPDILVDSFPSKPTPCPEPSGLKEAKGIPETIRFPIFGKIETKNVSLPFFTVIMGLLDGFNPCAMWTLLFLISFLLGMENRKRMWILGIAFIVTSAFVYFLFMAAWLNLFLFLGFIVWVRIVIGLIALAAGIYNLREYWLNKEGICKVTNGEKRRKTFARIKKVAEKKEFVLALIGIIFLAFAVNLVELICSAGLPAVYTQVLTLSHLPSWQYYGYLLIYIFFFMIDDLFIFFGAMITLQAMGIETKYARFSHLIGGSLMLLIGLLLLLKPEWLMFG